jgi:aerobic carbon-monoxide dehydrogenase large subunit
MGTLQGEAPGVERLLDIAARELRLDSVEIRRKNLIPPAAFPYDNKIIYQDFARSLRKWLSAIALDGLRQELANEPVLEENLARRRRGRPFLFRPALAYGL